MGGERKDWGGTHNGIQGDPVAVSVVSPTPNLSPHLLCPHCPKRPRAQGASTAIPMPETSPSLQCPHDVTHPSTHSVPRVTKGALWGGEGEGTGHPAGLCRKS